TCPDCLNNIMMRQADARQRLVENSEEEDMEAAEEELIESDMIFESLPKKVSAWSRKRYGDRPEDHPILEIIDNPGDISLGLSGFDHNDTLSAVGCIVVSMADYYGRHDWSLQTTWEMAVVSTYLEPINPIYLVGKLAHSRLGVEQSPLGSEEEQSNQA